MSNGCRPIEFMNGGILTNVTIIDSKFLGGLVDGAEVKNAHLTAGVTADDAAAQDLADIVGSRIFTTLPAVHDAAAAAEYNGIQSTVIIGGTGKIMGEPAAYLDLGNGYVLPLLLKKS